MTTSTTPRARTADPVTDMLGRLVTHPAALAGVGTLVVAGRVHLPRHLALALSASVIAAVSLATVVVRDMTATGRLRRAMSDAGLIHRDADGVVHTPMLRGRSRRDGAVLHTRWALPPGIALRTVLDRRDAIGERCAGEVVCWMEHGLLHVELLRRPIPPHVAFADFYRGHASGARLRLGLGIGRRGSLWVDLTAVPHLLVGGMTGGGKSMFLRQAVTGLALRHGPDALRLVCIDLKGGVELARIGALPHALRPVADSVAAAAAALSAVRVELDHRLVTLRERRVRDLDGLVAAGLPCPPRVLVVVDELAELTLRDLGDDRAARDAHRAAVGRLCEIARLGRAAGVHLLVCTQRPDADAVPGQLKANLPGTVAFRVRARVNSEILLDDDRAALLPHRPGRALWAHERVEEFQAVHLDADESDRLLDERWGTAPMAGTTVAVTQWCQSPESNSDDAQPPRTLRTLRDGDDA